MIPLYGSRFSSPSLFISYSVVCTSSSLYLFLFLLFVLSFSFPFLILCSLSSLFPLYLCGFFSLLSFHSSFLLLSLSFRCFSRNSDLWHLFRLSYGPFLTCWSPSSRIVLRLLYLPLFFISSLLLLSLYFSISCSSFFHYLPLRCSLFLLYCLFSLSVRIFRAAVKASIVSLVAILLPLVAHLDVLVSVFLPVFKFRLVLCEICVISGTCYFICFLGSFCVLSFYLCFGSATSCCPWWYSASLFWTLWSAPFCRTVSPFPVLVFLLISFTCE